MTNIEKQAKLIKTQRAKVCAGVREIANLLMMHNLDMQEKPKYSISFEISGAGNVVCTRVYDDENEVAFDLHVYNLRSYFEVDRFYFDETIFTKRVNELLGKIAEMKAAVVKYIKLNNKK